MVFERTIRPKATEDRTGKIRISIRFDPNSENHKNNITKSFTVLNATVSEVAEAIEQALFGEDNHE